MFINENVSGHCRQRRYIFKYRDIFKLHQHIIYMKLKTNHLGFRYKGTIKDDNWECSHCLWDNPDSTRIALTEIGGPVVCIECIGNGIPPELISKYSAETKKRAMTIFHDKKARRALKLAL